MGRVRKFGALAWKEQFLFSEAYFLHLAVGLALKVIPFRWIPRVFSCPQLESPTQEEAQSRTRSVGTVVFSQQSETIELIRMAVQRAGMVSPWKNRCLVSSLAARSMLNRRKIASQVSLGLVKKPEGGVIGHAWIRVGQIEIIEKKGDCVELFLF